MFACVHTNLVEEVTTVVQQPVQHQNCIRRQGSRQAKAVSKLLSSGQAMSSTAQVLLPQHSINCLVGEIGLKARSKVQALLQLEAVRPSAWRKLRFACMGLRAKFLPVGSGNGIWQASKEAGGERQALGRRQELLFAGHNGSRDSI